MIGVSGAPNGSHWDVDTGCHGCRRAKWRRQLCLHARVERHRAHPGHSLHQFTSYSAGWLYATTNGAGGAGDNSGIESAHGVGDPSWFFLKPTSVENPANTPVFVDGAWVDAWPAENDGPAANLWTGSYSAHANEMGRFSILRHGGKTAQAPVMISAANQLPVTRGVVAGMADGHVEFSTLPHLWSYNWHKNWGKNVAVTIGPVQQ